MMNPITRYRKEKGLTQVQLSILLNMSVPSVVFWEGGGVRPGEEAVKGLATLFQVQPNALRKELEGFYAAKRQEVRKKLAEV